MIQSSTRKAPERRSDVETGMVSMVSAALSEMEKRLERASTEAAAMLDAADGERMIRDAAVLQEESKLIAARGRAAELRVGVSAQNDRLREAMKALNQAAEAQESGDA